MIHDVISAIYQGGYLIELEFNDGQRGTVDFTKYLERRGVFERFRDLEFFRIHFLSLSAPDWTSYCTSNNPFL